MTVSRRITRAPSPKIRALAQQAGVSPTIIRRLVVKHGVGYAEYMAALCQQGIPVVHWRVRGRKILR